MDGGVDVDVFGLFHVLLVPLIEKLFPEVDVVAVGTSWSIGSAERLRPKAILKGNLDTLKNLLCLA